MGTAASSRWFMGPCVHFGLRGWPVLVQMDGIKPPQHDACCWCCHFIHPHIKSHLRSIGRFSGAGNAIKGNGEGRPNSSRKPSSPAEEPSSCPARFRIARVRLCHFSTASVPAATRRRTDGTPGRCKKYSSGFVHIARYAQFFEMSGQISARASRPCRMLSQAVDCATPSSTDTSR